MREQNRKVKNIASVRSFEATGILVPTQKRSGKNTSGLKLETEGDDFVLRVPKKLSALLNGHLWEKVLLKGVRKEGSQEIEVKSVQSVEETGTDLDIYDEEILAEEDGDVSEYAVSIRQTGRIYPDVAS